MTSLEFTEFDRPKRLHVHIVQGLELGDGTTGSPAHDRFAEAAATIESALDERDWLLESDFTVADVMSARVLQGAESRELLRPWPGLEAYMQRSESLPLT